MTHSEILKGVDHIIDVLMDDMDLTLNRHDIEVLVAARGWMIECRQQEARKEVKDAGSDVCCRIHVDIRDDHVDVFVD